MKRLIVLLALLAMFGGRASAQVGGQATPIVSGPTNPATCDPTQGWKFFNNSTTPGVEYYCDATNHWSPTITSPSFWNKYFGISPDDCGNVGCTTPVSPAIRYVKFCYDGVVTGQPTTTFKSLGTATITNTVAATATVNGVSGAIYTYTISAAVPFGPGEIISVTGSTNGAGVFNVTNKPILNYATGATTFTVFIPAAGAVTTAADTGTATGSCANFQSADATSTIEILAGGLATALDVSTTISAVVSTSQVTLGANATTNATGKKFWYGTDATTPLQNWQNAIDAGIPTATGLQTHSGYLPGMYLTTKPVRLINPLAAFNSSGFVAGVSGGGYGTPEPWNLDNANEPLSIWGQGPYRSGIVGGALFNWASAGTANNTGVFYYSGWNGPTLQNFAVLSGDYGIAYNTSSLTGKFGGFFDDANAHESISGLEIENFHNTTSSLVGDQMVNGTYESSRNNVQVYNNDCAGVYANASGVTNDGLTLNNYIWGGTRGSGCNPGAAVVFGLANGVTGNVKAIVVSNFKLDDQSGSADMPAGNGLINFASGFNTNGSTGATDPDEIHFSNGRIFTRQTNNFAISFNSGVTSSRASFENVEIANSGAAGATTQLILNQSANLDIQFFGGSLSVNGTAANCLSNATGSVIHTYGTRIFGTSCGIVGTGAAAVSLMTPNSSGWTGPGTFQATASYSNQGAALATITPGAGWGTGATSVPCTTRTGFTNSFCIVVTSGSASFSAAPTLTITLPTPIPSLATPCNLNMADVTGAGGAIILNETTLSTTAPVFTAKTNTGAAFTPAVTETYTLVGGCGP